MMRWRLIFSSLLLFVVLPLYAATVKGLVIDQTKKPRADLLVVIAELDKVTTSDSDGKFTFTDVPAGSYTLRIIQAETIDDYTLAFTLGTDDLNLQCIVHSLDAKSDGTTMVAPEEKITAKRSVTEAGSTVFDRRKIAATPLPGNNAGLIANTDSSALEQAVTNADEGVNDGSQQLEAGLDAQSKSALNILGGVSSVPSVYGADPSWNSYYYDYIRLPVIEQSFGIGGFNPVVRSLFIERSEFVKGVAPLTKGPGLGSTTTMYPINDVNKTEHHIYFGLDEIGYDSFWKFNNFTLTGGIHQSLAEFTLVPILSPIIMASQPSIKKYKLDFLNGDYFVHGRYDAGDNIWNFDLLGFYNYNRVAMEGQPQFAIDSGVSWPQQITIESPTYFNAIGAKWQTAFSTTMGNDLSLDTTLYIKDRYYSFREYDNLYFNSLFDTVVTKLWSSFTELKDNLYVKLDKETMFTFGLRQGLIYAHGQYENSNSQTRSVELQPGLPPVVLPTGILNYYSLNEAVGTSYGFARYSYETKNFLLNVIAGATLIYPQAQTLSWYPQVEFSTAYNPIDNLNMAYRGAWSYADYEGTGYIQKRINEGSQTDITDPRLRAILINNSGNITTWDQLPRAVSNVFDFSYRFKDSSQISLDPFIVYYYDIDGGNKNSVTRSAVTDRSISQTSMPAQQGLSFGSEAHWKSNPRDFFFYDLAYTLSWNLNHDSSIGWYAPNTDIRHTLKATLGLQEKKEDSNWALGVTAAVYFDKPFNASITVPDSKTGIGDRDDNPDLQYISATDASRYNSWRDYIPSYTLTLRYLVENKIDQNGTRLRFELNTTNLLAPFAVKYVGIAEDKKNTIGVTTEAASDRHYVVSLYDWPQVLALRMGLAVIIGLP